MNITNGWVVYVEIEKNKGRAGEGDLRVCVVVLQRTKIRLKEERGKGFMGKEAYVGFVLKKEERTWL